MLDVQFFLIGGQSDKTERDFRTYLIKQCDEFFIVAFFADTLAVNEHGMMVRGAHRLPLGKILVVRIAVFGEIQYQRAKNVGQFLSLNRLV